ncbi:hypothetical protein ACLF3G_24035 [Falsiroseomonas sp. HC035]|uniref:hypothetical protein n=1 Tax=Falsiroseomonas sp. HC035 TaxID=3390999 RepID=UPI003D319F52
MMRVHAATAQKERELLAETTSTALSAAKAGERLLGGHRGYPCPAGPDATAAAQALWEASERAANRLVLEVERLRADANAVQQSAGTVMGPSCDCCLG